MLVPFTIMFRVVKEGGVIVTRYMVQCIGWSVAAVIFVAFLVLIFIDAALRPTMIGQFAHRVLEFPILPWLTGRQSFFLGIGWKLILGLYILHRKKLLLGRR